MTGRNATVFAALLMAVVLGGLPVPAHAQGAAGATGQAERDQRARSQFEQGRQAYEDGRYRDAWANFHEAYQLSNRPELLYNIGQTADRLGQDTDALKAFRMYLERLPAAQNRRDVENRIHALEERVSASSQPPPQSLPEPAVTTASPTPGETAPAPPAVTGKRNGPARRGFYGRAALGIGVRTNSISGESDFDANIDGYGFSADFGFGYAVLPGFVVGGALYLDWTGAASLTSTTIADQDIGAANLITTGPFADWYLKRETTGWHIQGAATIAILSIKGAPTAIGRGATGIGFMLGGGYEWPIAGDFSFGVLGRLTLASMTERTSSHVFISPSVLASLTWF